MIRYMMMIGLIMTMISVERIRSQHIACSTYVVLDDPGRHIDLNENRLMCDNRCCGIPADETFVHLVGKWVKLEINGAYARIPNYLNLNDAPRMYQCGTRHPGYFHDTGGYPTTINEEKSMHLCYRFNGNLCYEPVEIKVVLCGNFYVYNWTPHHKCWRSFCSEEDPQQPPPPSIYCYGKNKIDPQTCSGHGECVSDNTCECDVGYEGDKCDYISYDKTNFLKLQNVEANGRFFGFGENANKVVEDSTTAVITDAVKADLGAMSSKTIRDVCTNQFYGLAVDAEYKIYMWGDDAANHYLGTITSTPTLITPVLDSKPKKIACTRSSLFILTFKNTLYSMGKNLDFEMLGGSSDRFTTRSEHADVHEIETSAESLYVVYEEKDGNRRVIKAIGRNPFGCLGVGQDDSQFTTYQNVLLTNFPDSEEYPRIQPMYNGVLFSYAQNKHYFAGKDHPSVTGNVNVPTLLDFDHQSQLQNGDPIDFFSRMFGDCSVIISHNKIFVSGTGCPTTYGLETPSEYPYEIIASTYNGFLTLENKQIVDFKCSYACYVLTEQKLFAFGAGSGYVMMTGDEVDTTILTDVSDDVLFIIPGKGSKSVFGFYKPAEFRVHNHASVNEHPTRFVRNDSQMASDELTVVVIKPEVFKQMDPIIKFGLTGNRSCEFEGIGPFVDYRIWDFWNEGGYDYYRSRAPWSYHTHTCGWESALDDINDYTIYSNRIFFEQKYFLEYVKSKLFTKGEDFFLDVMIKFKNSVTISVNLNITKNPFGSNIAVFEKNFNRDEKDGLLKISIQSDYPLVLINPRFTDVSEPTLFNSYSIVENDQERSCDDLRCYQTYELAFDVRSDVCVLFSDFTIIGDVDCTQGNDPNCQVISDGFEFTVKILTENICLEVVRFIELEGSMEAYADWKYEVESYEYFREDFVWFKVDVNAVDQLNTLTGSEILEITFNDDFVLYTADDHTDDGREALLILDDDDDWTVTQNGFHFKMIQKFLGLDYGETDTFKVSVKIGVDYLGNDDESKRRETTWVTATIPNTASQGATTVIGITSPNDIGSVTIKIISIVAGSIAAFVGIVVVVIGILVVSIICYKKRLKKIGKKEEKKDDEKDVELKEKREEEVQKKKVEKAPAKI